MYICSSVYMCSYQMIQTNVLICFICLDIQCRLTTVIPSNGRIACGDGSLGFQGRYKGDLCFITCNTGYERIGSVFRTCQSDGNWSGNETMCIRGGFKLCE